MPAPKRTRAADEQPEDNERLSPDTPESSRRTRRSPLRRHATAPSALSPARTASTERRRTRPPTASPTLTRSASLFGSSRGGNGASASSTPSPAPSSLGLGVATRSRGGMLLRAHSTSAVPSLSQIKEIASGGSGPPTTKGGGDNDAGPSGSPRFGKGKENIPPPREPQPPPRAESSRKRVRVSSTKLRNRSSSISSLRSESAGKLPSLPWVK